MSVCVCVIGGDVYLYGTSVGRVARVDGQGPVKIEDNELFWFRNKPGKVKVDITVKFRSETYTSPKDREVTVTKSGMKIDVSLK